MSFFHFLPNRRSFFCSQILTVISCSQTMTLFSLPAHNDWFLIAPQTTTAFTIPNSSRFNALLTKDGRWELFLISPETKAPFYLSSDNVCVCISRQANVFFTLDNSSSPQIMVVFITADNSCLAVFSFFPGNSCFLSRSASYFYLYFSREKFFPTLPRHFFNSAERFFIQKFVSIWKFIKIYVSHIWCMIW